MLEELFDKSILCDKELSSSRNLEGIWGLGSIIAEEDFDGLESTEIAED
jgi:hypothetical protein